jgi:hypothetical protein
MVCLALENTLREILKFYCGGATGARLLAGARPVEQNRFTGNTREKFSFSMHIEMHTHKKVKIDQFLIIWR